MGFPASWTAEDPIYLPPSIQDMSVTFPDLVPIARVLSRTAENIHKIPYNTVEPDHILNEHVEFAVYMLPAAHERSFIAGARKVCAVLGGKDWFRGKYRKLVHPLAIEWVDQIGVSKGRRESLIRDVMRCLEFLVQRPEFRSHRPYEFPISVLERYHVLAYRKMLLQRVNKGEVVGASERKSLGHVVRWIRWLQETRHVLRGIDLTGCTVPKSIPKERKVPVHDVFRYLIHHYGRMVEYEGYVLFILLQLCTGARPVELLQLTKDKLDFSSQTIRLQSKAGPSRSIPLPTHVWGLLTLYLDKHGEHSGGGILRNTRHRPMSYDNIKSFLHQFNDMGFRIDGSVALRHRFATDCNESNIDTNLVCYLLGHKNPDNLPTYQHVKPTLLTSEVTRAFEGTF